MLSDLQIFSGGVYSPSATSRTISFSISNSFWYFNSTCRSTQVKIYTGWSHQLTSDLKRCLLFRKCLRWSSLKAVSVPCTSVKGGLRGSTATSGSCHPFCCPVATAAYMSNSDSLLPVLDPNSNLGDEQIRRNNGEQEHDRWWWSRRDRQTSLPWGATLVADGRFVFSRNRRRPLSHISTSADFRPLFPPYSHESQREKADNPPGELLIGFFKLLTTCLQLAGMFNHVALARRTKRRASAALTGTSLGSTAQERCQLSWTRVSGKGFTQPVQCQSCAEFELGWPFLVRLQPFVYKCQRSEWKPNQSVYNLSFYYI